MIAGRSGRGCIPNMNNPTQSVDIDIYSKADIRIARIERDTFILDRIEAGITLYRASRDAPLNDRERRERRQ